LIPVDAVLDQVLNKSSTLVGLSLFLNKVEFLFSDDFFKKF
jgi:hypothetical protein